MKYVRFEMPDRIKKTGYVDEDIVYDITDLIKSEMDSENKQFDDDYFSVLISESFKNKIVNIDTNNLTKYSFEELNIPANNLKPYLTKPFDPPEVWCAGVTYKKSRDARLTEAENKTIYDHVYSSPRPEIFLKATDKRVVGQNDWVGIRNDSHWMVPNQNLV
jgi:2-dehydro-3-deoxy-D-arabinonate dehydratase